MLSPASGWFDVQESGIACHRLVRCRYGSKKKMPRKVQVNHRGISNRWIIGVVGISILSMRGKEGRIMSDIPTIPWRCRSTILILSNNGDAWSWLMMVCQWRSRMVAGTYFVWITTRYRQKQQVKSQQIAFLFVCRTEPGAIVSST